MAPNTKLLDAVQVAQAVLRLELALTDAATQCKRLRAFFDDLVIERMGGAHPAQLDVTDVAALVTAAYQVLETLPAAFAGEPRAEAAAQLRAALTRLKPSVAAPGGAL